MSKIPTRLTHGQFQEYVEPFLSTAERGFVCQIPLYRVFNYVLYWLHTGCQWDEIPTTTQPGSEKKKSVIVPFTNIIPDGVMTEVFGTCGITAY